MDLLNLCTKLSFMKRGRPSIRYVIYELVSEYFSLFPYPSNVRRICKFISERLQSEVSWNTVKKYLEELAKMDKLKKIKLEHSRKKGEEGITLYAPKS